MANTQRPEPYKFGRLIDGGPGSQYETYLPDDVPIIYADGLAGTNLGANVSRVTLYNVAHLESQTSPPREIRAVSSHVVLPTNALIEFVVNLLRTLKADPDIGDKFAAPTNTAMSLLDKVSVSE
jgi:hypothetical protein